MTKYPKPLKLCGVYYRVKREGKWETCCFSDLTPDEMDALLARMSYDHVRGLVEAEFKEACGLVEYLKEDGWELPRGWDLIWTQVPVSELTGGNTEDLREVAKLIARMLHGIGEMSGTSRVDPESEEK